MEPLNNIQNEQVEEASKMTTSFEKAESVTSETSSSNKMKIEELTGEEDTEVDSTLPTTISVKSSNLIINFNSISYLFYYIYFSLIFDRSFQYFLSH